MASAGPDNDREVITLPNGARVVFDSMPNLRTSAVGVYLAAGARHASDERNGLAHFLEHMAFKSAAGRNARERTAVLVLARLRARLHARANR